MLIPYQPLFCHEHNVIFLFPIPYNYHLLPWRNYEFDVFLSINTFSLKVAICLLFTCKITRRRHRSLFGICRRSVFAVYYNRLRGKIAAILTKTCRLGFTQLRILGLGLYLPSPKQDGRNLNNKNKLYCFRQRSRFEHKILDNKNAAYECAWSSDDLCVFWRSPGAFPPTQASCRLMSVPVTGHPDL